MKYIKLFESQNKSKTKQGIFKGYVYISEDYNQISAKELIGIGLENMETYFTAKKYNL